MKLSIKSIAHKFTLTAQNLKNLKLKIQVPFDYLKNRQIFRELLLETKKKLSGKQIYLTGRGKSKNSRCVYSMFSMYYNWQQL